MGDSIDDNSATELEGQNRNCRFVQRAVDLIVSLFRCFNVPSSVAVSFEQMLQVINCIRK